MYDAWNQTQRDAIMWSIINNGLQCVPAQFCLFVAHTLRRFGLNSYTNSEDQSSYGWWQSTNGNVRLLVPAQAQLTRASGTASATAACRSAPWPS
jgi:uncharacterized cupin superfamily protein